MAQSVSQEPEDELGRLCRTGQWSEFYTGMKNHVNMTHSHSKRIWGYIVMALANRGLRMAEIHALADAGCAFSCYLIGCLGETAAVKTRYIQLACEMEYCPAFQMLASRLHNPLHLVPRLASCCPTGVSHAGRILENAKKYLDAAIMYARADNRELLDALRYRFPGKEVPWGQWIPDPVYYQLLPKYVKREIKMWLLITKRRRRINRYLQLQVVSFIVTRRSS
jgi:hypothetical protein